MRSYFVYVRTLDNQFFNGCLALDEHQPDNWVNRVYAHFQAQGNPLPRADLIHYIRYLADPRNLLDMAGYEEEEIERATRPPTPEAADSYCCVSEYESGVTPTH